MKSKMILLAGLVGTLAVPAFGQTVELTLTGSTAFRSVVTNRVFSLYSSNSFFKKDGNTFVFSGVMPSVFPSSPNKQIKIRMSYSGSATGMQAVKNGTQLSVIDPSSDGTTYVTGTALADIAMSDVFPSSATPPMTDNDFARRDVVGVVPFVFVKNTGPTLAGVTGMTREQAVLLMSSSGLMPATFLGGSSSNPVLLCGRDAGSGTRITTEKCIGFFSTPYMATNDVTHGGLTNGLASGLYVGYNSGGTLASQIKTNDAVIGYLGLADYSSITNGNAAAALSYNGVPYTSANVISGKYSIWGYEHIVSRPGLSADQQAVRNALVNAIKDSTFQHNDASYVGKFEALSDMQVSRGADGGPMSSLNF